MLTANIDIVKMKYFTTAQITKQYSDTAYQLLTHFLLTDVT